MKEGYTCKLAHAHGLTQARVYPHPQSQISSANGQGFTDISHGRPLHARGRDIFNTTKRDAISSLVLRQNPHLPHLDGSGTVPGCDGTGKSPGEA